MPNSEQYRVFQTPSIAGGLDRSKRRDLIEPGRWWRSRGWWADLLEAVKAPGFISKADTVPSPEFQDYYEGGTAFMVQDTFAYLNYAPRLIRDVMRSVADWQFKLVQDPDSDYSDLIFFSNTQVASAVGAELTFNAQYNGSTFGNTTQNTLIEAEDFRRYILRNNDTKLDSSGDAQPCPINLITVFYTSPGNELVYICTPRDIYLWSDTSPHLGPTSRKTQTYSTGTVANIVTTAVTGNAGTNWDTSGTVREHLFKLDSDGDDDWTRISSVGGATSITLLENYRGAGTSGAYKIIQCYNGAQSAATSRTNKWFSVNWLDGDDPPGDIIVFCNGNDVVKKHDGVSPEIEDLNVSSLTTILNSARIPLVLDEHLCLGYTTEGGSDLVRRVRWSNRLDAETWTDTDYRDIPGDDYIVGATKLQGQGVWMLSRGIVNQRAVGAPFDFAFIRQVDDVGCVAGGSIQAIRNQTVVFMGPDNLYSYDLIRAEKIGEPIQDLVYNQLDSSQLDSICSIFDEQTGLYLLSIPTADALPEGNNGVTYAFDVDRRVWLEPSEGFTAFGRMFQAQARFIDDFPNPIDTYSQVLDQRFSPGSPILVAGSFSGQLYEFFTGAAADLSVIDADFELGMTDLEFPGLKRLGWLVLEAQSTGAVLEVTVGCSMDGSTIEWGTPYNLTLDEDCSTRDLIVPVNQTAKYFSVRIRNRSRVAMPKLRSLNFHWRPRGTR